MLLRSGGLATLYLLDWMCTTQLGYMVVREETDVGGSFFIRVYSMEGEIKAEMPSSCNSAGCPIAEIVAGGNLLIAEGCEKGQQIYVYDLHKSEVVCQYKPSAKGLKVFCEGPHGSILAKDGTGVITKLIWNATDMQLSEESNVTSKDLANAYNIGYLAKQGIIILADTDNCRITAVKLQQKGGAGDGGGDTTAAGGGGRGGGGGHHPLLHHPSHRHSAHPAKPIWRLGGKGVRVAGKMLDPWDFCTDDKGRVYVADGKNARVLVLDGSTGHLIQILLEGHELIRHISWDKGRQQLIISDFENKITCYQVVED